MYERTVVVVNAYCRLTNHACPKEAIGDKKGNYRHVVVQPDVRPTASSSATPKLQWDKYCHEDIRCISHAIKTHAVRITTNGQRLLHSGQSLIVE
jgi:hypothetical protein